MAKMGKKSKMIEKIRKTGRTVKQGQTEVI